MYIAVLVKGRRGQVVMEEGFETEKMAGNARDLGNHGMQWRKKTEFHKRKHIKR